MLLALILMIFQDLSVQAPQKAEITLREVQAAELRNLERKAKYDLCAKKKLADVYLNPSKSNTHRDSIKGISLLEDLVRHGDMEAAWQLGLEYSPESVIRNVPPNQKKSLHYIEVAATGGHPQALHNLGLILCSRGEIKKGRAMLDKAQVLGYVEVQLPETK